MRTTTVIIATIVRDPISATTLTRLTHYIDDPTTALELAHMITAALEQSTYEFTCVVKEWGAGLHPIFLAHRDRLTALHIAARARVYA